MKTIQLIAKQSCKKLFMPIAMVILCIPPALSSNDLAQETDEQVAQQATIATEVALTQSDVPPPKTLDELNAALAKSFEDNGIPGAQVALFNKEEIFFSQSYGLKNKTENLPVDNNTLFRAGSTSKTFLALAIMQMVNQGKFSLQDDVAEMLPELNIINPFADTYPVRVIHLLEHTAGFDDMHFRNMYNLNEPNISLVDATNRDSATLKVRWKPGTRHAYSNPGYAILGVIVEKFSGQSYEAYLTENILVPLQMNQSSFTAETDVLARMSEGYISSGPVEFKNIYLRSAGALNTTATELAKFAQFILANDRHSTIESPLSITNVDSNTIALMEKPESTLAAKNGLAIGYAKAIYGRERNGSVWLGHDGGIDGFLTSYAYNRESNTGYAIMINSSESSMRSAVKLVTEFLNKDLVKKAFTATPFENQINGYYRMANDRNQIFAGVSYLLGVLSIQSDHDKLLVNPIFGSSELVYHLGDGLVSENLTSPAIGFIDPAGAFFEIDGQYFEPASAFSIWWPIVLFVLGLLSTLFYVIYSLIWLSKLVSKSKPDSLRVNITLLASITSISLIVMLIGVFSLNLQVVAQVSWQNLCIFMGSIGFAVGSWIGIPVWISTMKKVEQRKKMDYWTFLVVASSAMMAIYFVYFDYIGLRLWAW